MKKISTFLVLLVIIGVNIVVLSLKDPLFVAAIFLIVGGLSIFITSPSQTINHLKFFIGLAVSILVFQIIFARGVPFETKLVSTARVVLQLFIVSEVVRIEVKYISPVSLISFFTFLSRRAQLLIAMTFYFIPLTMKEYEIIKQMQLSRGLGRSIKSRLIAPIAFIIPLLHRVFQRSEVLTYSILSRGWREE